MMPLFPTFWLLILMSILELLLSSPTASLLPLKRQKKYLQKQEDLAYFLPEKSYTPFRQHPNDFIQLPSTIHKKRNPSVFSERQQLLEGKSRVEERRRKRPFESHRASSREQQQDDNHGYVEYERRPDPWFPALDEQKRQEARNSEQRDAIDSALKHMAWERLNKRLIKLHGLQGPYLDRGERRIQIKKRAPAKTLENKKVLEAILSDDTDDGNLENETNPKIKVFEKSNLNQNNTRTLDAHRASAADKSNPEMAESSKNRREPKGKEWMPLDSEHTLRSKKSWDDYFGIDKRSPRFYAPKEMNYNVNGDDDDDEDNVDDSEEMKDPEYEQELKDYLVQWYFNKMLKQFMPQVDEAGGKKKKKFEIIEIKNHGNEDEDGSVENVNLSDGIPFEEVDGRLRKIEDAILLEATHLLEREAEMDKMGLKLSNNNVNDDKISNEIEKGVVDHLKAAFSLEKMRDALEEFQDSFDNIKLQEKLQHDIIEEMSTDTLNVKKKKKNHDNSESDEEIEDQYIEDDKKKKKKSMGAKRVFKKTTNMALKNQPQSSVVRSDLTNEVAVPVFTPEHQEEKYLPCPVMTDALGYCEELSEALGEMGRVLARPCVEHMLCYTCDEIPSMCDTAFLQDAAHLCEDDFRCQAIAGAMRSVFLSNHDTFRHRNHALCDMDQCLLKLQGTLLNNMWYTD